MTNLQALQALVPYPLDENSFLLALTNRSLTSTDTYTSANKRSLELAQADLAVSLITAPNITEGGYTLSHNDRVSLQKLASGIYKKWGVKDPFASTAQFVNPW